MKIDPKKVHKIIHKHQCDRSNLLAILTDIQNEYNWLPPETLTLVSRQLEIPLIDVYGVASFYHAFSLTPRGKHVVTVCQGTACHVRGAPIILNRIKDRLDVEPGCTTHDDQFTLETVNCLGACALAPIVVVDGDYHGQSSVQKVDVMLTKYKGTKKKAKKKIKKKIKKKRVTPRTKKRKKVSLKKAKKRTFKKTKGKKRTSRKTRKK